MSSQLSIARPIAVVFHRAAIHAENGHSLPHEILLQAVFNGVRRAPHGVGTAVREDPHEEVHRAAAHQLTKEFVRKESFIRQGLRVSLSTGRKYHTKQIVIMRSLN